jgi:putative component of toxin-antitoxin plasmid stabilization module
MPQHIWQITTHEDFDLNDFINALEDNQRAALARFLELIQDFEDLARAPRSWIKPLGQGLFEFRIRSSDVLLRLFFTYREGRVILLVGGYDKRRDPSEKRQNREIAIARKRLLNA